MSRPLMSTGNHKLSKDILVFNLNRGVTCPGQSPWCRENCYDIKSYRYPAVKPARDRNLAASKECDFVERIVAEIRKKRKTHIRGVRIHGSGDFYNQNYLRKWINIAEACPHIRFKANTRSYMLNYTDKPDNLMLRYSIDETTKPDTIKVMKKFVDGFAYIAGSQPEGTAECHFHCGFDCDACSFCYSFSGDITYHVH